MAIYPMEDNQASAKYLYRKEEINGVRLVEGQKLFIDGKAALIIRAWKDGIQTDNLIAVCAKPYRHLIAADVVRLMYETELALNPDTPNYRDVKVRVENRTDDFDVMAYSDRLAQKFENS